MRPAVVPTAPLLLASTLLLLPVLALAQDAAAEAKVRDNLFLLEEAYNQEPGVIQHIQVLQLLEGGWEYGFTEEWPVPTDVHQLSVTLPLQHLDGGPSVQLGDVLLNYRHQAVGRGGEGAVAVAPRLSLVLPTGSWQEDAGRGGLGLQLNLPVSVDLARHWVVHLNGGLTWTPRAQARGLEEDLHAAVLDTNAGAALVFLPVPWANLLVEVLHETTQEVEDLTGERTRTAALTVNPGVRFAIDHASGLQVVPGVSVPVTRSQGETTVGALLYLSLEHPLWR